MRDPRLTEALQRVIPAPVLHLCKVLHEAGFRSWLVGGCIRDELLALSVEHSSNQVLGTRNDWDLATDAKPEQLQRLFPRVIPTGIQHGTVTVLIGKTGYELTTLRGEAGYTDGRRPDSVFYVKEITEDLARRDFTVNAMAYDPLDDRLHDPFGGIKDLQAKCLRAVGDPRERFAEDGLRLLRAARFVATLELDLEENTEAAMASALDTYRKVSPERVRDEWLKTMKARQPSRAFEVMRQHGLLAITAPELLESVNCEQNQHHAYDVWHHSLCCLDHCPSSPVLRLAGLLHDIGKPRSRAWSEKTDDYTFYNHDRIGAEMVKPLLARLRFSKSEQTKVAALVRHHIICYDGSWGDAAVRRWVRRVSPDLLEELYQLNQADISAKGTQDQPDFSDLEALKSHVTRVMTEGAALTTSGLAINGRDLMEALDFKAGPTLGKTLNALLEAVIESPALNSRQELLELAATLKPTT